MHARTLLGQQVAYLAVLQQQTILSSRLTHVPCLNCFLYVNRIKDLVICKDSFTEANEMLDEMKTLADYGITGSKRDNEAEIVNVFYDFKSS
jgi:hypothetical protein